jgi:predicted kinase
LLNARIAAGRVCDGHGDLLADDVYCMDDGPRVLDCLEFDDRLRYGDVLADVAFLAMDLERLGRRDLSSAFLTRYREQSNEDWPVSLAHFYVAYRAHIRAKVACLRHSQSGDKEAAAQSRMLLMLAHDHLRRGRVRLVLIGGSPGTGKTTLATAIGQTTGWDVLHSDVIRKELAGLEPLTPVAAALDTGLYNAEWNERTYRELLDRAGRLLAFGRSVLIDASWSRAEWRDAALRVAQEHQTDVDAMRCDAPIELAATRTRTRPRGASDAEPDVARAIAGRFAPWPEAAVIDTSGSLADATARALAALDAA